MDAIIPPNAPTMDVSTSDTFLPIRNSLLGSIVTYLSAYICQILLGPLAVPFIFLLASPMEELGLLSLLSLDIPLSTIHPDHIS